MKKLRDITVLVTASGAQFMPGLVNCLKNNGERQIKIIGTDMSEDPTLSQLVDVYYKVPNATDPGYIPRLLEICKKEKVTVLMPFMSSELIPLADHKKEFEDFGTLISISDKKSIENTTNKLNFYTFMKDHGLNTPRFASIHHHSELLEACEICGYPENAVCVKATELSGSRGIRIIDPNISRYDILFHEKPNSFYTTMDDLLSTLQEKEEIPEMMAMEYLPGKEGSVDLIADNGNILYMAYRESNVNLHSIPQVATLVDNPEAFKIAKDVISALKLTGNADLDFKADANGQPVLMEINPRIAATMQIFKEGGLNFPYLRIKHLLRERLPKIEITNGIIMKRRYLEMFYNINYNPN